MMESSINSQTAESKNAGRQKKNIFPRLALNKVLELAEKIYELGQGDPVPRLVVFDKLGKSPESGPSRMLVSTSNSYGLTTGSYKAERLGITERGRATVTLVNPAERKGQIVQILLENSLFAQFYEKYTGKSLPAEPIGIDYLKQAGGLNDADAKSAYAVFVENLTQHGFTQELSGRLTVISKDMMNITSPDSKSAGLAEEIAADNGTKSDSNLSTEQESSKHKQIVSHPSIVPQFNFNIQVQIPDNASSETYDAIFKSIAQHLLKS